MTSESVVGNKIPILCNQENFILRGNSYKINQALPDYFAIIKPAVKKALDKGRPRNGMFVAVPDKFKNVVSDVSPDFWRLQAIKVQCGSTNFLLINSYFPVDPRTVKNDDPDLSETIEHLKNVIEKNEADQILLAGDINCDFLRNTGHVKKIEALVDDFALNKAWDNFEIDFTMCHEMDGSTFTSKIDHFFWSQGLNDVILDAGVLHLCDNMSDHSPIYCVLNVEDNSEAVSISENIKQSKPKPCWKSSTQLNKDHFTELLDKYLDEIKIPQTSLDCRDVHCSNDEHNAFNDRFIEDILAAIEKAAYEAIPCNKSKNPKKPNIVGWNDKVKPFKESALFWHQVWDSADRPLNTELHRIMKRTRNLYHYNIRKCKKTENIIARNKLLDSCLNGNGDLFKEIRTSGNLKPQLHLVLTELRKTFLDISRPSIKISTVQ